MKITKTLNYKKPLYAIGVAAALTAAAVTGCGPVQYSGDVPVTTAPTEEVVLAGEVAEYQIKSENESTQAVDPDLITGGIVCPDET